MASEHADLPVQLRAFLHSCIETIEQVEIVMILRGSQQTPSAREVSAILRLPPEATRRNLETLTARGILDWTPDQVRPYCSGR